jgi:hypothetical protein
MNDTVQILILLFLSNPRLFSGLLSAVLVSIITFVHLEPLFEKVDIELSEIALYFLALLGAGVGTSLGVLVPKLAPGACLGATFSILLCSVGLPGFFAITPTFALVGALIPMK